MKTELSSIAALLLLFLSAALAWGQAGHRVIGELAQERINGRTRAEIEHIGGVEDLAETSTWADEERSNSDAFWQEEAGPWHTLPFRKAGPTPSSGAPPEGDAYTAPQRFTATLCDAAASREDKALALHFIVHIDGDLHQPLHAGNGTDRGGNVCGLPGSAMARTCTRSGTHG